MIKKYYEKNELLQDFLHKYLNYVKDELLADGKVIEAQIVLSRLDSHLYLWDQTKIEMLKYQDILESLQRIDQPMGIFFRK
ncbi:hypothetical protein Q3F77_12995 [Enterococcus faecium]|nr:hypothetical protein [Enterococcus faecium]